MRRSRAYERDQRARAIRRKKRICKDLYGMDLYKGVDGKYNKAHLGCGCGICKPGKRFHRPSGADERKTAECLQDLKEYWAEETAINNKEVSKSCL